MYILGINAYHGDSSACIIKDGEIVAAAEEERFRRIKHWAGFPSEAINYCLEEAGISPREIDHIGVSRNPSAHLHKKALFALSKRPSFSMIKDRLSNMAKVKDIKEEFCKALELPSEFMKVRFHNVEHHRAHMASSFLVSPFEDAAVLSIDGFGDFVSTMWGVGKGNKIEVMDYVGFPHSLGLFYTAVTQYLGFLRYGDEYKVMGLASYGEPEYLDDLRKIVKLKKGGRFELDLDCFLHHSEGVDMTWEGGEPVLGKVYSDEFIKRLGPPRNRGEGITRRHENLAASLQAMSEEAYFYILNSLHNKTKKRVLCVAGGVAFNSVANGKIFDKTPFEEVYIQAAAGDAGTALGAGYYIYHQVLGNPRRFTMTHAYWGPGYSNENIEKALKDYRLNYDCLDEGLLLRKTAQAIADGKVVGWFQGRMEWGPRALGNRSILVDPRRRDMKDILNARIKRREPFRPFAPSILIESVGDYFERSYPDPFMIKVYPVKKDKREIIPAVTHVDGTGRLQTVSREENPVYWRLIKEFEKLTGVPVVLNTSFNENEPVVCKPQEAIECFLRTKMDVLVVGNYFVEKDNPNGKRGDGE
jgi:carbamoyltransferase